MLGLGGWEPPTQHAPGTVDDSSRTALGASCMGCKSSVGCSDAAVERVVQVHVSIDVMVK